MTITRKKYTNDFQIVYEPSLHELPLTTLYVFCDVGSVYEHDHVRGACHFIEHMCFKGTRKITAAKIIQEYSKIGAYFNAYTSKRYTCYTIKCQDKYIHHSLEILADMLLNSTFIESEFRREKRVVVEENNNNDNNPGSIVNDAIQRLLYKGSSYEHPVDTLNYHVKGNLQYKAVVDFYHTFYDPSRMFLSVVSNASFKDIEKILKKTAFLRSKSAKIDIPECNEGISEVSGAKRRKLLDVVPMIRHDIVKYMEPQYQLIEKRGITNVHLSIGFKACGYCSPDYYPLFVLSKIMGDGLSGRLMLLLRERKGLVYTATASINSYSTIGDFTFDTITTYENLIRNGVLPLLIKLIREMIIHAVTKEELDTIKGNIQGSMLLELQNIVTQTKYNGESIIYGCLGDSEQIVPYKDIYSTFIKDITLNDIKRVIQQYFTKENMCVCILSEKLPSLETIRKECVKISP